MCTGRRKTYSAWTGIYQRTGVVSKHNNGITAKLYSSFFCEATICKCHQFSLDLAKIAFACFVVQRQMRELMVRAVYCEMLGYEASFSYIHAIKLAQQGNVLEKRVGMWFSLMIHKYKHVRCHGRSEENSWSEL